jgi:hypothetical protein
MILVLDYDIADFTDSNKYVYEKYETNNKQLYPTGTPPANIPVYCTCNGQKHIVCFLIQMMSKYNDLDDDHMYVFRGNDLGSVIKEANIMALSINCSIFFISI